MCTLSVAPSADGSALRVMMNRDERRLRMAATPPMTFTRGVTRAVWPVDQQAGGTWIAANDAGLVLALMNANPGTQSAPRPAGGASRGMVIPALISARSLDELEPRLTAYLAAAPSPEPFTLVAIAMKGVLTLSPGVAPRRGGDLWSSSALGDGHVEAPRRALFDRLLASSASAWTAQDRLHQHAWPDRRHLSVLMSRADACTVSRTEVVISADRAQMRYAVLIDGWPAGVSVAAPMLTLRPELTAA